MTLDLATRALVENSQKNATKPRHLMTPAEARELLVGLGKVLGKGPEVARKEDFDVAVAEGSIPVRLLVPPGKLRALLIYFHGGGWVIGSNDEFEPMCREIAVRSGCAIAMACYRKAPEHPFPVPLNDAWTAFNWIAARRGPLLDQDDVPVLVGGDSAGANLAAVVAIRDRNARSSILKGQLLIYPVTDANFTRPSFIDPDNQAMLTSETMIGYWNHYLPDPQRRKDFEASPLRAADLSALPPAIIVTAEHDVLRDEGEAYAARLREAGVPVTHKRFEGQMHAFMMMIDLLPGSAAALEFVSSAIGGLLDNRAIWART